MPSHHLTARPSSSPFGKLTAYVTTFYICRKVKELEKQRLEAEALRARTVELEKALVAKEAEVSRVRLELQHSAPGAHSAENWCAGLPDPPQSSGAACAPADGLAGKAAAGAPAPGSKMSCAEKLNRLFSEQVVELREYWTAQGLDAIMEQQMSEGGKLEGAEAELEKGMLQRMDNICTTCMYTLRAEGLRIEDVLERDDVKRGKLPSSAESRDLWRRVVSALKLSDDQKARIMHMRERSLRSLRETYLERHRLNARAIAALARKVQGFIDNAGDSLAFPCLEDGTLAQRQHENIKLADLLDKIRENLRAEQRTLAELQVVVHRWVASWSWRCYADGGVVQLGVVGDRLALPCVGRGLVWHQGTTAERRSASMLVVAFSQEDPDAPPGVQGGTGGLPLPLRHARHVQHARRIHGPRRGL